MKDRRFSIRNAILFSSPLDNIFWHGTVTRPRDRCQYFGAWKYITITAREWNNITFPSLFQENELHCRYRFVKCFQRQWNLMSHILLNGIEADLWCSTIASRDVIYGDVLWYNFIFWTGAKLQEEATEVSLCVYIYSMCVYVCLLALVTRGFIVLIKRISFISLQATVQTSHCQ